MIFVFVDKNKMWNLAGMAMIVLISVASRNVNDLFDCQENGTQMGLIISDLILHSCQMKS